jgi:phosphoglycerol transferase MdoB-like AlkP superfamily enzyme
MRAKNEFRNAKYEGVMRITLPFVFVSLMMFFMNWVQGHYELPEIYFKIAFLILGICYLYQIYAVRRRIKRSQK